MENMFTPEQENMPVTYGALMDILTPMIETITRGESDIRLKIADILGDYMIQIRDDADYKRQRDIRFMINLIAQIGSYDKDMLSSEYKRWCDEFDKINKPQNKSEVAND